MRHTKGKARRKRSHHGIDKPALTNEGGVAHMRHRASRQTGMYRGRRVIDTAPGEKAEASVNEKTNGNAS